MPDPCTGLARLNPMCIPLDIVQARGTAAKVTDPFGTMAGFFSSTATNATTWLWKQINEATTLDLNSPHLVRELGMTAAIAAVLCIGLFLVQVITAALRGHPVLLARAVNGLIISFVGSAFAIATTRVLLTAVDALSNGVVQFTMGTNIAGLQARFAFIQLTGLANPATIILVSLVVVASAVIVWAAMMIRKLMILLAAVLAPLAFAGATAEFTRGWVRKWIEFMAAMIASKLLLVIILSLGLSVLNGAGQSGAGATQTVTQLAGGSLILLLGGLAPWGAIRMFHFAGDTLYAAHSATQQSAAGAQAVLHSPQKVAALQASARAFGGGPRSGGSGGPGGGAVPPPPRPAPTGPAGSSGTSGPGGMPGPSGPPSSARAIGPAGMATSNGGAAAATSAAVPVAGAVMAGVSVAGSTLKGAVNTLPATAQSTGGSASATSGAAPVSGAPPTGTPGMTATTGESGASGMQRPPKQPPTSTGGN